MLSCRLLLNTSLYIYIYIYNFLNIYKRLTFSLKWTSSRFHHFMHFTFHTMPPTHFNRCFPNAISFRNTWKAARDFTASRPWLFNYQLASCLLDVHGTTDHLALNSHGVKTCPRLSLDPCAFHVADWDSELSNSFVPEDHRVSYADGFERAIVLTCEWPVSTPKPPGPRRGHSFLVPLGVKMEQKSS